MNRMIMIGLFVLIGFKVFSQEEDIDKLIKDSNFKVIDNELIWQKVYSEKVSITDFKKSIVSKNSLENISIIDSTLFGNIKWFMCVPVKGLTFPIYMLEYISGNVKVDFRAEKYRITISNIRIKSATSAGLFKDVSGNGVETSLITYYYKPFRKEKVPRENFYTNDAKILDSNFLRLIEYKPVKDDF